MSILVQILIEHGYAESEDEASILANKLSADHLSEKNEEKDSEIKLRKLTDNHKTLASIMCGLIPRNHTSIHSLVLNGDGEELAKTDQLLSSLGINLNHS